MQGQGVLDYRMDVVMATNVPPSTTPHTYLHAAFSVGIEAAEHA
jgi:hypothetical protein